jgi:DNA (cytosine-5)-methyltransferase 1
MRIGSLFAGVGGLESGLEAVIPGAHTVFQVEADKFARSILEKHWPQAERFNDVRKVNSKVLPPCDLLCGGFPCQDISVAGAGAGLEGARSGLWSEFARIVGELRPRYVVVENVSNLRVRGFGRVLGDLASFGYDAIWDCVPAAAVGAPHRRDRLFIVAWLEEPDSPGVVSHSGRVNALEQPKPERRGSGKAESPRNGALQEVAHTDGRRRERKREQEHGEQQSASRNQLDGRGERRRREGPTVAHPDSTGFGQQRWAVAVRAQQLATERSGWWQTEPNVGRVADGVPSRVDRLKCLGNAVVPQVAQVVGRVVLQLENSDRGSQATHSHRD